MLYFPKSYTETDRTIPSPLSVKKKINSLNFPSFESSALSRFVRKITKKPTLLETQLKLIQNSNVEDSVKQQVLIRALESKEYARLSPQLKIILKTYSNEQLKELMDALCLHQMKKNNEGGVHRCFLNLLSIQQLSELTHFVSDKFISAKETALQINKIAHYIEKYEADSFLKDEYRKQSPVILSFLSNFVHSIMATFNLLEVKRSPGTYFETKYMLDIYCRFLSVPLLILQALQLYFMNTLLAFSLFAGALTVSSLALYVYFKWLEPCPDDLPYCQNLTMEAKKGNLAQVNGRDKEIGELIQCLSANNDENRKHPIVIGQSGVGKTELINILAHTLLNGKNVPAELKKKKIFCLNSIDLVPASGGFEIKTPLDKLMDAIGSHGKDIILFMDEFHACVTPTLSENTLGMQLLTRLHISPGSIPFLIAATTEEDYNNKIEKTPLKRRLDPIVLEEMSEKQTLSILRTYSRKEAPDIQVDDSILKYIYTESIKQNKKELQPGQAKHLLASVLTKMQMDPARCHALTQAMQKLQEEHDELTSSLSTIHILGKQMDERLGKDFKELETLEDKMKEIQKLILIQEKGLKKYQNLVNLRKIREQGVYDLAKRLLDQTQTPSESLSKELLFHTYFLLPSLQQKIDKVVNKYHLQVRLTEQNIF